MPNQKRLAIEVSVALVLILACFAVWSVSQSSCRRQLVELQARQESVTYQMRQQCEARTEWLATSEATDAFRAFAAGIQGAALRQQKGMLDMAKTSLLRMPYVAFVHVLEPDGKVLTSSDEKFSVAGRAGARASWALQPTDMQTRPGDLPVTIEIAAPFQDRFRVPRHLAERSATRSASATTKASSSWWIEPPRPRGVAAALRELPQALGNEGGKRDA